MFGARYGPFAGFCNHCNELWGSVQAGNFSTMQTAVYALEASLFRVILETRW